MPAGFSRDLFLQTDYGGKQAVEVAPVPTSIFNGRCLPKVWRTAPARMSSYGVQHCHIESRFACTFVAL